MSKNILKISNFCVNFVQFIHNLFNFKTCQLTELEINDSRCLNIIKLKFFNKSLLSLGLTALAGTDCCNNFVNNVNCTGKTL